MNIKLFGIEKIYKEKNRAIQALGGINLDINEGNYVTLVGPSGSGKTTLLSIIGGLIKPTSGDIYFDSKKLTHLPDHHWSTLRKKHFGFIFQKKVIIPHLTVLENIMVPLVFDEERSSHIQIKARAEELLADFEMETRKNDYPDKLSGGELQRVTIVRSLMTNPRLLLADEPTGDLDKKSSEKIINALKNLNKNGMTIIMVTHNMDLARTSRTIYSIKEGRIEKVLKG
ncbi:MAG: ABC transporter ATP-binding protein [Spirochaetes bacterium]|nr:ABC transporter ATP-binding protein [Spirochaetota bacterium]